jgi:hypothetical protein
MRVRLRRAGTLAYELDEGKSDEDEKKSDEEEDAEEDEYNEGSDEEDEEKSDEGLSGEDDESGKDESEEDKEIKSLARKHAYHGSSPMTHTPAATPTPLSTSS